MKNRMQQSSYASAKKRALRRKAFLTTDGEYLSRDEAHERSTVGEGARVTNTGEDTPEIGADGNAEPRLSRRSYSNSFAIAASATRFATALMSGARGRSALTFGEAVRTAS